MFKFWFIASTEQIDQLGLFAQYVKGVNVCNNKFCVTVKYTITLKINLMQIENNSQIGADILFLQRKPFTTSMGDS